MSAIDNNGNTINSGWKSTEENVWIQSTRLTLNLLTHIFMFLTVLLCLLFACQSVITLYHLHIILSVLGYQFCMCQGTLIMSKYNTWSVFIKRRYRKQIHWTLQIVAAVLVTVGSSLIIYSKTRHFTSIHGIFGLSAVVCCLASLLNGILSMYPNRLCPCINVFWVRLFHYVTGIGSLFLATGSLCAAFKYRSFTSWIGRSDMVTLIIAITWIFTVVVSLDFWIILASKIRRS